MDIPTALLSFSIAAALLTITPGLDTALVLRTAAVEGPRRAMLAGAGVVTGVLAWGLITALGLGAILAVSDLAYRAIRLAGAAYLIWLGAGMLRAAIRPGPRPFAKVAAPPAPNWFLRGVMTNLLNPKVGVFYVSFLPQFLPEGVPVVAFSVLLAGLHAAMGLVFFAVLTVATVPFQTALSAPRLPRILDGLTGSVLIAFALRLLAERRVG
ncbi:LysE family translocator [Celeribacter indicus]|uniref:Lysine exporter protein LysE/YggA n=1 Tax=Celeribacter indicus TaxID=1208324 RepID=A0A0B5E127_9RHOB|nr:LysE family translocator [Celeribacter indicus]AJE47110.1 lysine exporter protein LysE/YggA [Celeribacter indicus]SDW90595.1 Threonine/homoserine/homoserine lactone efflux protein [Celeribacter indicus]